MQYQVHVRETADQPIATVRGHSPVAGMPEFVEAVYGEILGIGTAEPAEYRTEIVSPIG